MSKKGTYSTPAAFLMALKRHVQSRASETGRPYNRELQLLVMDRFAARVMHEYGDRVGLMGLQPARAHRRSRAVSMAPTRAALLRMAASVSSSPRPQAPANSSAAASSPHSPRASE